MLEAPSVRPHICEQIRSGPLGHWVDDFVDVLSTRGYATSTMRRYVRAAAIFSAWLDQQRVAATDIDETRPGGRRDRAILLLLTRLGLRAAEAQPSPSTTLTGTTGPSV